MTNWGVEMRIDPRLFPFLNKLAPGVVGMAVDHEGELWVPVIHAMQPGQGDVGCYLDTLPNDRRVVFPNVINDILAGMLQRRGFRLVVEQTEEAGAIEVWERCCSTSTP